MMEAYFMPFIPTKQKVRSDGGIFASMQLLLFTRDGPSNLPITNTIHYGGPYKFAWLVRTLQAEDG